MFGLNSVARLLLSHRSGSTYKHYEWFFKVLLEFGKNVFQYDQLNFSKNLTVFVNKYELGFLVNSYRLNSCICLAFVYL